jgi:hypothetical protein
MGAWHEDGLANISYSFAQSEASAVKQKLFERCQVVTIID